MKEKCEKNGKDAVKRLFRRRAAIVPLFFAVLSTFLFGRFLVLEAYAASLLESGGALDFSYDIGMMSRLNPDFTSYPDAEGIVWLKQLDYRSGPDGGIERRSLWVILGRQGLSSRWLSWHIPAPEDGSAEILEASAYSPVSLEKIGEPSLVDVSPNEGGGQSVAFDTKNLPETFVLAVSYREFFAQALSIEDLVWTEESLPVWETLIGVTVPAGSALYYNRDSNSEPTTREVDGRTLCEWRFINTPAKTRFSLRGDTRSHLAFGTRKGSGAASFLKNLEAVPTPPPPVAAQNLIKDINGKNKNSGEKLLRWLYEQPTRDLPERSGRKIPAEGPWTAAEKVRLAHAWLKNTGADAHLFWRLAYAPDPEKPLGEFQAVSPVMELDGSFFDMNSLPRRGESSSSLWGETVWGVNAAGQVLKRDLEKPAAADNRLDVTFDLRLSDDGLVKGNIRIRPYSAWRYFLLPEQPAEDDLARMIGALFASPPRYEKLEMKGNEIVLTLSGIQAIKGTGGRNILVSLPALIPSWFDSLARGPYPYTLSFPFTMNLQVKLALPRQAENNIPLPAQRNRAVNSKKVRYTESWRLNKKNVLLAEARLNVAETVIADETAADLDFALQDWHVFMSRNLPVRLKN